MDATQRLYYETALGVIVKDVNSISRQLTDMLDWTDDPKHIKNIREMKGLIMEFRNSMTADMTILWKIND